jgi:hypothetical protein
MDALQLVVEPIEVPTHVTTGSPSVGLDKAFTDPALDGLGAHVEHLSSLGGGHEGLAGHAG